MAKSGIDLKVPVPDGDLHAVRWGDRGPVVLLVHGTGLLARLWTPLAEQIAADHQVVAIDLKGHGDSVKAESGYDRLSLAADLLAVLDRLDLGRPAVLAHSAGATVTALAAARAPDRFGPIALVEPILQPPGPLGEDLRDRGRFLAAQTRRRRSTWPSTERMITDLASKPAFARWRPEYLRLYATAGTFRAEDGAVHLKCPPAIEAQLYETGAQLDPWPHLTGFPAPAWIVRGAESQTLPAETVAVIAAALGVATTATIPGAGHFVPQEQPDAMQASLTGFWRAVASGDP